MSVPTQTEFRLEAQNPWSLPARVAFRFGFVYAVLYSLMTQVVTGLVADTSNVPDLATFWPVRQIVIWTAAHVFKATPPVVYVDNGSGDKIFNWVLVFCLLVASTLAAAIWSSLDRERRNCSTLYRWLRLFVRLALAGQMIGYGMYKVIPTQMSFPSLTRLVEPYGSFSPMGVLWSSIGASPAYESFAGCTEVLGGVLLFIPRTAMLGALVSLAATVQVFVLNMAYDIPVKLFSFHLVLMCLFLLAPDAPRLANLFLRNRPAEPSTQDQLFFTAGANRIALAVQILLGIWLLSTNAYGAWQGQHDWGSQHPKSPLYGIWDVNQFSIDGQIRPPLLTDNDRWRRVIFDRPTSMNVQRMDDSFVGGSWTESFSYGSVVDINAKTIALTRRDDEHWKATFSFDRPARDRLLLDGQMDGHNLQMHLSLLDHDELLLVNRGFHWINEFSFNF